MNILLSNDDGIYSKGLEALAKKLSENNNLLIVAPDGNRSAISHAVTFFKEIEINKVEFANNCIAYATSGTPVDCVKIAKLLFKDFNSNIVIAGINIGHNLGSDVLYSGTVSIACEASFFGDIAFAFSVFNDDVDFNLCAEICMKIINDLLSVSEKGDVWNINFPNINIADIRGVKITKLGKQLYTDRYVNISKTKYMLVGELISHQENDDDCDVEWIKKGYITITPIILNKTNYDRINEVKDICIKL